MCYTKRNNSIKYFLLILVSFFILFLTSCEENNNETVYYNVGFIVDGEKTVVSVEKGSYLEQPENPTKEGYEFKGWFYGKSYFDFSNTKIDRKMNLVAKWNVNKYKLIIQYNNGTSGIEENYNYGEKIIIDQNEVVRSGYSFDGWNIEVPETMPAHDVTLYAKWKINTYNLVIKYNNGLEDVVLPYTYNQEIELDKTLLICSKEGYKLTGWSEDVPTSMPASDVIIEANWEEIPPVEVTIAYNNGVTENQVIKQVPGTKFPSIDIPTKDGYTFMGWSKSIPEYMPDSNMTIEAIWVESTYTLTIHNYFGEDKDLTQRYLWNEPISVLDPILTGYTFKGYYTDSTNLETQKNLTIMDARGIEVTALWELTNYEIRYHYDEEVAFSEKVGTYTILSGDFKLVDPTKEGYLFRGWYKEETFNTLVTTIEMNNLVDYDLYAKWDKYLYNPSTTSHLIYNGEKQSPVWKNVEEGASIYGDCKEKKESGTYTAIFKPLEGYCWLDGTKDEVQVDWTIQKREITIEWSNFTVTYNGYNQYPTAKVIKDNGDSISKVYVKNSYRDIGSYEMTIDQINKDFDTDFNNYIIHNDKVLFTINKAIVDECVIDQDVFVYNGQAPEINISRVYANKKVVTTYDVSGDFTHTDAGKYSFTVTGKGNWEGSITVYYEIIKTDSSLEPSKDGYNVLVGDTIKISDLVKNNTRALSVEVNNTGFSSDCKVNGQNITIGALKAKSSDTFETSFAVTEAGDQNHNAKTVNVKIIVTKKESVLSFSEDYYTLNVDEKINVKDIGITGNPAVSDPVYHLELISDVDYLIVNRNTLTIQGQYKSGTSYATIRVTREASEAAKAGSIDIKVKVEGKQGLTDISLDGSFVLGKTCKIKDGNVNKDYSIDCYWYYVDNGVHILYEKTNELEILNNNYAGKTFGCTVVITNEDKERIYDVYEASITEGVLEGARLLKKPDGSDAKYVWNATYNEFVWTELAYDGSEATGNPMAWTHIAATVASSNETRIEKYDYSYSFKATNSSWSNDKTYALVSVYCAPGKNVINASFEYTEEGKAATVKSFEASINLYIQGKDGYIYYAVVTVKVA